MPERRSPRFSTRHSLKCTSVLVFVAASAMAQTQPPPKDLSDLSIENLMNVEITSVSKREQKLSQAAAAIFVITQEDIRRSGATNIPDLLRMVPGLEVAQINATTWAITSRGFNSAFADKMLVLIDGRSVYTPLFSGVFWDDQDSILEDIERIEVIRGPGATVWGANAVNGVINIITKKSSETQGGLLTAGGGSLLQGFGEMRQGGKIGPKASYRVYGKYFNHSDFIAPSGQGVADQWQGGRAGFRADWQASDRDALKLEGEMYRAETGQLLTQLVSFTAPFTRTFSDETATAGGHALARWTRNFSPSSDLSLQVYFDRTNRKNSIFGENRNTFDVDFQHHFVPTERQDFVWGLGYRYTADGFGTRFGISLAPNSFGLNTFSAFAQDQITLVNDRLFLTIGSKFEHNDFTGFEIQPTGRLLWAFRNGHALWGAVSRAVRTPSRADRSVDFDIRAFPGPGGITAVVAIMGTSQSKSEDLLAYEAGYRAEVSERVSVDFATFYNVYQNVQSTETGMPFLETNPSPPHLIIPNVFANGYQGHTYGAEISAHWQVASRWRLSPGYTLFREILQKNSSSNDTAAVHSAGNNPRNQFQLRSALGPFHGLEFNSALYVVGKVPNQFIPMYSRFDSQLAWRVKRPLELSIVVQNAFNGRHQEFGLTPLGQQATVIPRSVYGQIRWRY